jgi:hypothetical protein
MGILTIQHPFHGRAASGFSPTGFFNDSKMH